MRTSVLACEGWRISSITVVCGGGKKIITLIGMPRNNANKVSYERRHLTFQNGRIPSDGILLINISIIVLLDNWNSGKRACTDWLGTKFGECKIKHGLTAQQNYTWMHVWMITVNEAVKIFNLKISLVVNAVQAFVALLSKLFTDTIQIQIQIEV
jgi:hypothetical protein